MTLYLGGANNGTFVSSDGYTLQDSEDLVLTALPVNNKYKIILNNVIYRLNLYTQAHVVEGIVLLSADEYTLKDINGLYITAKDSD